MFRIWLLRLVFSWWVIPLTWIVLPSFLYLITGDPEIETLKEFTHDNWYGWHKL